MDQQTLLLIFVATAAVALLIQAGMLIGIYVVSKKTGDKLTELLPSIRSLLSKSEVAVSDAHVQVMDIGIKTNAILDNTRSQLAKIEDLVNDASSRARVQLDRAEMVIDDTVGKAQSTVNIVHRGIVTPIREVHGVISGLRAALGYLGQHRRTNVEHVTADEEMFI
jgi:hypothetical protein